MSGVYRGLGIPGSTDVGLLACPLLSGLAWATDIYTWGSFRLLFNSLFSSSFAISVVHWLCLFSGQKDTSLRDLFIPYLLETPAVDSI